MHDVNKDVPNYVFKVWHAVDFLERDEAQDLFDKSYHDGEIYRIFAYSSPGETIYPSEVMVSRGILSLVTITDDRIVMEIPTEKVGQLVEHVKGGAVYNADGFTPLEAISLVSSEFHSKIAMSTIRLDHVGLPGGAFVAVF